MKLDKQSIDVCLICTLRPEILKRTLESFTKHVKYSGVLNAVANVDIQDVDFGSVFIDLVNTQDVISKYFSGDNRHVKIVNFTFKPNFAQAVKTCWKNTTSEFVFNLEDDWEFIADIDLDRVENYMKDIVVDYMRFPKIKAPKLDRIALQPSMWRGSCVRELSAVMSKSHDPEKQLRPGQGNEAIDRILERMHGNGLEDYEISPCCKDIGREWREDRGYKKWDKNSGGNITWSKQ